MNPFTSSPRRSLRSVLIVLVGFVVVGFLWRTTGQGLTTVAFVEDTENTRPPKVPKAFVVASFQKDDVNWVSEHFPDWEINRYVVDNPSAQFTVPKNKGRESMVYLTYIIDNYDKLPDLMVFMHANRYQWHNDDPLYDGVPMLKNLQLPYLLSQGYANLRCVWTLGCPSEMNLEETNVDKSKTTWLAYPRAFKELFPNETLPKVVGVACCAQFSLTRSKIRERPIEDYKRYRQWLLDTPLEDHISGRVLEYSWHFIFGKEYVHCPNAKDCYCNIFGFCNLECGEKGKCGERWPFPPSSSLPDGWPGVGWKGEVRDQTVLASLRGVAVLAGNTSNT
ncbi:hypothetical protein BGZ60DRAFT_400758 [Tricladium varicosporioides]|nr:hypothetical protein BGZ60DRAFT_400758 [Hymenoscyphus varicosporioides]